MTNPKQTREGKMKKSKREKFSFHSGKAVWKQKPITEWEIRCWVNDFRGLIHHIYLAILLIGVLLIILKLT